MARKSEREGKPEDQSRSPEDRKKEAQRRSGSKFEGKGTEVKK